MRFPPGLLDEIRARLPVSEVVGRRVKLKKQGREWRGLSPFNKERTPSFFVNDQKQFYHDFSSGKHGDIFKFVMETEGLTFPEAVERLASVAGVALPKFSAETDAQEQRRRTLYDILELAAKFFEASLASKEGASARGYLADRSVHPSTQLEFRIGYAPASRFALKEHLASYGISNDDMIEAGLLIAGEDIPVPYGRFRDRVIIPIADQRGRIVGFGGRTLNDSVQPKYLNSPETPVFHKGATVFNFHRARQAAHDAGSVVAVEGYMDAIAIYQAGIHGVVATMGTAFTEEQINTLWKLSDEPIVCFDGDKAGISAAYRSVDRILPELRVGRSFRFAFMSGGQDPDELIRTSGVDAFRSVLSGSLPLWEMLWEREIAQADIRTPDGRAVLEKQLYDLIRTIKDPIVGKSYYRTCRVRLSDFFWTHDHPRARGAAPSGPLRRFEKQELTPPKEGKRYHIQLILLGMLVEYPEFLDEKQESVARINFDLDLEGFRRSLYYLLLEHQDVSVDLIYRELSRDYYDALELVHGERNGKQVRGYQLRRRFKVVGLDPPRNFISECIELFVDMVRLEELRDDIAALNAEPLGTDEEDNERHLRRIVLKRELQLTDDRINYRDSKLADEAQEIRRIYQPTPEWNHLAA